jgi:hypothetical protein
MDFLAARALQTIDAREASHNNLLLRTFVTFLDRADLFSDDDILDSFGAEGQLSARLD